MGYKTPCAVIYPRHGVCVRTYEKLGAQGAFANLRKPWMAFESSMDAYSVFVKAPWAPSFL
jgi:hypothetical protein